MHLRTLPVFSKLADPSDIPAGIREHLPPGWQLSRHQLATYRALCDSQFDVVINTAMTGDGKSLAGLLPLLVDRRPTLALYPTNELIQDQRGAASLMLPTWGRPERWVADLYGERLDELLENLEQLRRGEAIQMLFKNNRLVLSNPDMLHYILQFCYQQRGRAPDWLATTVSGSFSQLTFDEFHIFDLPQVAAVLTGMLLLHEISASTMKTLFLSATPGRFLLPLLEAAGLQTHVVPLDGCYHHGVTDAPGWRPILQACDLQIGTQGIEGWLEQHQEDTLIRFFRDHRPGAKGAIIVNSLAAAQRVLQRITQPCRDAGITVLPNTGLTSRDERRASYSADLLVGTSTVDVGVDFQINFLVFESSDAGSFLQRLGRLGRHQQYTDSAGQRHPFAAFHAHALLPEFVSERLFVGHASEPPLLEAGATITREALRDAIVAAFPLPAPFERYLQRWGRFQPAQVISQLNSPPIRASYAPLRQRLQERYERTFGIRLSKAWGKSGQLSTEGRQLLVDEARAFRGGHGFMAGVLVANTGQRPTPQLYDLFWLLSNAYLELIDEVAFYTAAPSRAALEAATRRARPVAFFRLRDYRDERSDLVVHLPDHDVAGGPVLAWQAQVLRGLKVELGGADWLNALNRHLSARQAVALHLPGWHPLDARRRLRLAPVFPIHQAIDANGGRGSVALARAALLLDTVCHYRRFDQANSDMPFLL